MTTTDAPTIRTHQDADGTYFADVEIAAPLRDRVDALVVVHTTANASRPGTAERRALEWIDSQAGRDAVALERRILGLDE